MPFSRLTLGASSAPCLQHCGAPVLQYGSICSWATLAAQGHREQHRMHRYVPSRRQQMAAFDLYTTAMRQICVVGGTGKDPLSDSFTHSVSIRIDNNFAARRSSLQSGSPRSHAHLHSTQPSIDDLFCAAAAPQAAQQSYGKAARPHAEGRRAHKASRSVSSISATRHYEGFLWLKQIRLETPRLFGAWVWVEGRRADPKGGP